MNKNRNCKECIYHISGECSKWNCEMTTLEDYKNKVISDYTSHLKFQLGLDINKFLGDYLNR